MKQALLVTTLLALFLIPLSSLSADVPDTGQIYCYGTNGGSIPCPSEGQALFGQDANYAHSAIDYVDNSDGTVTDPNTGLMWQADPGEKVGWQAAMGAAEASTLAGYDDWRLPTIKELYTLINFMGITGNSVDNSIPYIDTDYFNFTYGDEAAGERIIDSQYWSSTLVNGDVFGGRSAAFGVNFADGRIKGYPTQGRGQNQAIHFAIFVRGDAYGDNQFVDNSDGTITDESTGYMWMQDDNGTPIDWASALDYCEASTMAGYDDWRLPDAHELQYIVDYSRSPEATNEAAIDPIFNSTPITNEAGQSDFASYWTSTTHLDGRDLGSMAVYVSFGRSLGYMNGQFMDVHGAGAQRSDPKGGVAPDPTAANAPQGDVFRTANMARCVRGGDYEIVSSSETDMRLASYGARGGPPSSGSAEQSGQTQGQPQQQGQAGGGAPPQEAIDACNGLGLGAACTINTPNGALSGTCEQSPDGITACRPPR